MKTLSLGPVQVGTSDSFERAFELAFSTEALEEAHGGPVQATPWKIARDGRERTVHIKSPWPVGVPGVLKRFVVGHAFRMTVRQVGKIQTDDRHIHATVENKTQFHIVCAKVLRTKSTFALSWDRTTSKASMNASASVGAWLPPPVKSIAESFVLATARQNLDAYFRAVAKLMSRDQVR